MTPFLAISIGGPLMLMFGILIALVLGCAAGYVMGTSIGRAPAATPLPTTIQRTRDQLAQAVSRIEKASTQLNASERHEESGNALVLARRIAEASTQLGVVGQKAKRTRGDIA